jgi:hypothetical protein
MLTLMDYFSTPDRLTPWVTDKHWSKEECCKLDGSVWFANCSPPKVAERFAGRDPPI